MTLTVGIFKDEDGELRIIDTASASDFHESEELLEWVGTTVLSVTQTEDPRKKHAE